MPAPFVTITAPANGAVLSPTFEVRGTGGGLFEGNVVVRAFNNSGVMLAEKATIVQSPTAGTGGSGPWAVMLTVNVPGGTPGRITAGSPGTPNVTEASVNVVFGTAPSEVKDFPPGTCQFQARPSSPFYAAPNGAAAGTFVGGTALYQSTQSTKVNGIAWYRFELDPGSGNPPNWAPISSIAAYTQGCVW